MILYYILALILLYLLLVIYIKIRYRIWTNQPVFQYYNILYWLRDDFIIRPEKANYHKYCNLINITTDKLENINKDTLESFIGFIQANFFKTKYAKYKPTYDSLINNLKGCNSNIMISLYKKYNMLLDIKTGKPIYTDEIIGSILSKPCIINFNHKQYIAFYADYLCINSNYRKKNIAAELIQTHEYERSHKTNNYTFFLVKRETKLSYIVPLVLYDVYQYTINNILYNILTGEKYKYKSLMFTKYSCIQINKSNFQLVLDYIDEFKLSYSCIILADIGNLYNMINNEILIVYALIKDNKLFAVYFYKKSDMIYYNNNNKIEYSIDLVASLYSCNKDIFISGFKESLNKINKKSNITYLLIENISENNVFINYFRSYYIKYNLNTYNAYYLYNYAKRPYLNYKTFIII